MEALLQCGIELHFDTSTSNTDDPTCSDRSPLSLATRYKRTDILRLLVC
jgi:hypothetical protein